ncbi:hypothetical protein AYL99_03709 [Fonsecaea erecta]|uniref:Heterokaryon incompatibility domain-containing protein n=1 Tax=Fonsecaea erecta TaxID=1367422 RepID=A0A178ZQ58_9EURO|nr:hypothetical protein AYL99_03709 [Fonsecaea erecta]OAP61506.1 hypothetical protein AYL99_03709 [Fonsecaea erecta]
MDWEQQVAKFQTLDFHPYQFHPLAECLESHTICQRVVVDHENSLPKRLLHLDRPTGHDFPAKLVFTEDIKQKPVRYVALSHCWSHLSDAEKFAIKTTPDNQDLRARKVDVGTFPRNYQAVMVMCRSFGFEYFWMDSICILQDDDQEWKEESVRMRHVYGAATLTIALNTSQDIFSMDRSKKITPEWEAIRQQCAGTPMKNHVFMKRVLEGGILGTRAWCFQERHLSPRLFHILDNGVVFCECAEVSVFTNAPNLLGFRTNKPQGQKLAITQRLVELINGSKTGLMVRMVYWHYYLLEYQRRALFDNTDNLTALAGIAESMQLHGGWTYLSGLWKGDLPRGMLWESTGFGRLPSETHKRFSHYHAPTWCWSSVNGSTRTVPELVDEKEAQVSDVYERDKQEPERDHYVHSSLVSDIYITGTSTELNVSPLPKGSALELKGLLISGRCGRRRDDLGVQREFTASDKEWWHDNGTYIKGSITFDVPSEAPGPLWCLLLVKAPNFDPGLRRARAWTTCLGIGLVKTNSSRARPGGMRMGHLGDEGKEEEEDVTDSVRRVDSMRMGSLQEDEEQAIHTFRRVGLMRLTITNARWEELLSHSQLLRII